MASTPCSAPASPSEVAGATVLLHMCCGPCSIMPVLRLREEGFHLTGLFFNPNIHPLMEYLRRREAAVSAAARLDLPLQLPDSQDPGAAWNLSRWLADVHNPTHVPGTGGPLGPNLPPAPGTCVPAADPDRCGYCYRTRLRFTARLAKEQGFSAFTTSLLYSRMQRHDRIREEGERAAAETGIAFLYRDFRPGWQEGIDASKAWDLYRQNYCGCIYSEADRFAKKLKAVCVSGRGRV